MKTRLHVYSLCFIQTFREHVNDLRPYNINNNVESRNSPNDRKYSCNGNENNTFATHETGNDGLIEAKGDGELSLEEKLQEIQEENAIYNNLQRLVRKSAEYEMPKTTVSTQYVYPRPVHATDSSNDEDSGTGEKVDFDDTSLNHDEDFVPYDKYDPVKVPLKANTTLELITGIAQMPKCQNAKGIDTFSIKDYTNMEAEPIHEVDILLEEINKRRVKQGKPILETDGDRSALIEDPEFKSEMRKLRLERAQEYRKMKSSMREEEEALKNTFYRRLPINDRGYRQLLQEDVDRLLLIEVREELKNRGYITSGTEKECRERLSLAIQENSEWRWKNIVSQELSEDNMNLPEYARNRIADINKKLKFINETGFNGDVATMVERLRAKADVIRFHEDPVGYLDLDKDEPTAGMTPEEIQEIKNAPVIYDVDFFREMEKPINRLADMIPPTFNLDPESTRIYPDISSYDPAEISDLKKEFLSIDGGIHEQTIPEIAQRFEVSVDFLGDACCRLGAKAPIQMDVPLRALISYSAIWDLVQYLNIADNMEIELYYSPFTVEQVARELQENLQDVLVACELLEIKLPFGIDTRLNMHCQAAVEAVLKQSRPKQDEGDVEIENTSTM
ncbi:hypothetical protein BdWA1_002220 [Babesia duncani]|uniref:Uncharacterized protein n=1 Tax=Babesia duncani TaxID=323732 RepID=A0AAD9PLW8_9APIC|nr:hypothetical protein BdWA1_002220 [Babesia duncani]